MITLPLAYVFPLRMWCLGSNMNASEQCKEINLAFDVYQRSSRGISVMKEGLEIILQTAESINRESVPVKYLLA